MTPEAGRAATRLMRVAADTTDRNRNPVAYWDARTSGNDARAALSIALGHALDRIDPATGTWTA